MSSQRISPARIVVILLLPALCVAAEQSEGEAREAPSPPMSVMVSVERTGAAAVLWRSACPYGIFQLQRMALPAS
ncbi:MAG TPA: hypothetical protein PK251_13300 [Candidatus Latescibacteria bacterium]|nr:hypothetical protein [Candidatus Latescibacterota bacterium]HPK74747.1 hypothetical protein [Candidatus Latescibacterota bacterium]